MNEAPQQYEFTSEQNQTIDVLSSKMKWVAYFAIGFAILLMIVGVFTLQEAGVILIVEGVLLLIIGIWTKRAAAAFQEVVATEGSDISNLMSALGELKKLYTLQFWLAVVVLVLFGLILVIGIIAGISSAM